jgi:hypothetical protein
MWSRRGVHAVLVLAGLCRLAAADETADIPDWSPGPATVAVTPFEIAEKSESVLGLDALGAPL